MAERARLSPEERAQRSRSIAQRAARLPMLAESPTVALYVPLGTEVDTLELARLLGPLRTVYPRSVTGDRKLVFAPSDLREMVRGPLGAREPPATATEVDRATIGCVVVPGIGFSPSGHRLGRGGGYYDNTLGSMPGAKRVGLAFEAQIVDDIPLEPHDERLDAIVTESRIIIVPGDR